MVENFRIHLPGRCRIGLVICGIWLLGAISACGPQSTSSPSGTGIQTTAAKPPVVGGSDLASKPAGNAEAVLADWPAPQAAIVFTGDAHGYLEPCGCTSNQSGGFARRGDLIRQLRDDKHWPVTALDVGGALNDTRVTYPQSRIKFAIMLKGLNELGYQGIALGKEELLLGPQDLYTEYTRVESEEDFHLPFLGANTTIFGTKELGTPTDFKVFTVGKVKIAVTAIAGDSTRKKLESAGIVRDPNELLVQSPGEVLPGILEKMKAEKPDLLVLLSASDLEESKALARQFPDFNIVVTSGSVEDPDSKPIYIGKTLFVEVGKKGKNAAVVGVYPDHQFKYAVLQLDQKRFEELPAMHDLMAEYQKRLKDAWPELSAQEISDPEQGTFVGAQECKSCHEDAYDIWAESGHAHAYASLITGREGQEENYVPRIHDPECLACHVTGWDPQRALRYRSGFIDMEKTPLLANQQCENCHGPGSKHVELENDWDGGDLTPEMVSAREAMRLTLEEAKANQCIQCHDGDNDPHFDFDTYWPKIAH